MIIYNKNMKMLISKIDEVMNCDQVNEDLVVFNVAEFKKINYEQIHKKYNDDNEEEDILKGSKNAYEAIKTIEAKLKEKNT